MARTTHLTRTRTVKVNLGHYESVDVTVSETVELEPGDDPVRELNALRGRIAAELQHDEDLLRTRSLYDHRTGRNVFVHPDDDTPNDVARTRTSRDAPKQLPTRRPRR